MRDQLETIKTHVREMRPYSLRFEAARVKLNQNENPWDMPIEIKRETFRRLQDRPWSRYPEFVPSSLIKRLTEFSGWTADGGQPYGSELTWAFWLIPADVLVRRGAKHGLLLRAVTTRDPGSLFWNRPAAVELMGARRIARSAALLRSRPFARSIAGVSAL